MARSTKCEWLSIQRFTSRLRDPRRRSGTRPLQRRLRIEPLEDRRLLALVTVGTLDDTVDFNDGVTSLREAIFATNLVGGADTIEFAASLTSGGPATLTLTQGELPISDALVINGPGANLLSIDASGNDPTPDVNNGDGSRVFNIDDGNVNTHKTVSIRGLTLTGGDAFFQGGAIFSGENLSVIDSAISGNSAISNSSYHSGGKGGGIFNRSGELTVTGSTISGNSANNGEGGGIYSRYGNLTVSGSSITGNAASGSGGGILSTNGDLTVTLSTISGNSAAHGGGIHSSEGGTLTVNTSTISENNSASGEGGGISGGYGVVTTVTGSTISGNSALRGGGISSYNGILTVTHSTISGNSALRGGGISTSKSLFGRPIGEGVVTVTDSAIDDNSATSSGGGIASNNCDLTVTRSTISGNSAGSSGGGIYIISRQSANLTVNSSTISGNSATGFFGDGSGGGIYFRGYHSALTVTLSTISGNSAINGNNGGGIYSFGTSTILTVTLSTISNNSVRKGGGGIWNYLGDAVVTESTISGNSVSNGIGGGIYSSRGQLTVTDSSISGNVADSFGDYGRGGGIYNRVGGVTVTGSTISGNSALSSGGGIFSSGSPFLTVTNSTISGNFAFDGNGGGIYSRSGDVTMTGSTLSGNSANNGNGGGLYVFDAASAIRHSTVTDNSADIAGGGGAFIFGGSLALDHTILARNSAALGPDLTGLIGTVFDVRYSLIGNNAGSGLAATPNGVPDANGNLIGPVLLPEPPAVYVEMAAMGDFEAGPGGDSFLFEYSIDGGAFQPLFTSSVDEAASQTYFMDRGTQVVRDDPLSVNGVVLNNDFQLLTAVIPASSGQIRIRFTASNDGPSEAFAWRNLYIFGQNSGVLAGTAVRHDTSIDEFAAYAADPDYTIAGDMFGIRSRLNQGIPSLPNDIADDSRSILPGDVQGIIGELDVDRFFGVVDTVNGVGSNTDTATWTFNNIFVPIDPLLGPLADNGGPTKTHALLPGSPALDAGGPTAVAGMNGVPAFDQRGAPHGRVFDGDGVGGAQIDIGAFELPPPPPALPGDYNNDGVVGAVDAADYVVWRKLLGSSVAPYSGADGSGNGVVDQADCGVWRDHFGMALPPPAAGNGAGAAVALAESMRRAALPRGSAAALAVNVVPSDHRPEPAVNSQPSQSTRRAATPPSDAVFTMLGQRAPARLVPARTALRSATVDAAISDSLLLVRCGRTGPTPEDDSHQAPGQPRRDADSRRERTGDVEEKWHSAVRWSSDLAEIVL